MIAQLLALAGLLVMALLPAVFFRRGRPTVGWLATAAPFVVDGLILCAALFGVVRPAVRADEAAVLASLTVPLVAVAVGLIAWTVRAHRTRPALWHQPDDEPPVLVTWGPYEHVRHPFYSAFALLLLGVALALPHPLTVLVFAMGVAQLWRTARREERRLVASRFGAEYARYMERTGRLIPRG